MPVQILKLAICEVNSLSAITVGKLLTEYVFSAGKARTRLFQCDIQVSIVVNQLQKTNKIQTMVISIDPLQIHINKRSLISKINRDIKKKYRKICYFLKKFNRRLIAGSL